MALRIAQWVHGTGVQIEFPERLDQSNKVSRFGFSLLGGVRRRGEGAYFRADRSIGAGFVDNWFHIAIPTPVILNGARPELIRVFVFYETFLSTRITNVHLFDGPKRIKEFNNLSFSGAHHGAVDSSNEFLIFPPFPILFGLGVSVRVESQIDIGFDDPGAPDVLFASAGADFIDSITVPIGPFTT